MRTKFILFVLACCSFAVFIGMTAILVDPPEAEITLLAFSPDDVASDPTKEIALGIPNVGPGQTVYLNGNAGAISYLWTLVEKPDASSVTLTGATTQRPTLIPDVVGSYLVSLVVTTGDGTSEPAELWITADRYVGVGVIGGATPDISKGQCAGCHGTFAIADKVTPWSGTKHATATQKFIDGDEGFFAESCLECHTVGSNVNSNNGGFDELSSALGWTFPSTLEVGNFDDMVANFPDLAALSNVQCESCHGPGNLHRGQTAKNQIAKSFEAGVCNQCHDSAPYNLHSGQWKNSKHFVATRYPSGPSRGSCVQCHTGTGFITTHDPDYNGIVATTYSNINCQTCHDPHSKDNAHQIRKVSDVTLSNSEVISGGGHGKVCMNCHMSRRDSEAYIVEQISTPSISSHFGPQSGPQTDMLFGTNASEFCVPVGVSPHRDVVENTCVTCHMQEFRGPAVTEIKTQFGVSTDKAEKLRDNVFGHSFWNVYTDDVGTKFENVKACNECHGSIESFDEIKAQQDFDGDGTIEGVQNEVKGMLKALAALLPPAGPKELEEVHAVTSHKYTVAEAKALYNFLFVYEDGSFGVHNTAYAVNILEATFNALAAGDIGAGTIASVTDVPNDQGKHVRVAWNRFPGDGDTDPKIINYGVWRKVDTMTGKVSAENIVPVADYDAMYASIESAAGKIFVVGETEVWDYIKNVPAAGLDAYATIAETIWDSTIAGGQRWSHFRVSGHSTNNSVVMSVADSGFSVDNLAPTTPQSLAFDNNTLTWTEPEDADFGYFAVYRSAVPGFTPDENTQVASVTTNSFQDVTVNADGSYYYIVSAYDFSGNESKFSGELEVIITAVDDRFGVPTSFALDQNYPNPFNPSPVIGYQLPSASSVKIVIYNVIGQEVRTLVNSFEPSGYLKTKWDGRDNRGYGVAPGIYFYKLTAGKFVDIKKMVFVK